MAWCKKSSTNAYSSSCCPSKKVEGPTVHQRAMTTYALLFSQNNDTPEIEDCHEVQWRPNKSIRSSGEMTMDPQNQSVDAMETYGEEDRLLATGTCTREFDYSTQWGRVGARTLSGDASVFWWVCSWTSWQMWKLFAREWDAKCVIEPYF